MTGQKSIIPESSTQEIPVGYCHCGCGQKTSISPETNKKRGYIKGEPVRFLHNHGRGSLSHRWHGGHKIPRKGHLMVLRPCHPRAGSYGYVFEHIIIAEKALGKPLPIKTIIHHHTPEQLVICQDQAYHLLLHQRQRALKACGHANWRKCKRCHLYDNPINLSFPKSGGAYHKDCEAQYAKKKRKEK
jgi:hypothetical protein